MNDLQLKRIYDTLKDEMSEARFIHSLGVSREITRMGEIYLPNEIEELQIAALLHDITKEYSREKQLQLCEKFGIILDNADLEAVQVIHSRTGAYVAYEKFPDLVTEKVASAIYKHTVASENMSLFDKLLFVADFTEPSRTNEFCITVRQKFWSGIQGCDKKRALRLLDEIILYSLDSTITKLKKKGAKISEHTLLARNTILSNLESKKSK